MGVTGGVPVGAGVLAGVVIIALAEHSKIFQHRNEFRQVSA